MKTSSSNHDQTVGFFALKYLLDQIHSIHGDRNMYNKEKEKVNRNQKIREEDGVKLNIKLQILV